nr:LacI family DNA-binding transcriptional regulator [Motilibacter rhizosphaerae]
MAKDAGVSVSTVSYVLSGKRPISATTRERVERSISSLGYHPQASARALASNRSSALALVVPLRRDVIVPVIMQFASGVVVTARTHDHDVLLMTQDEGAGGLQRVSGSGLVDALIVMDVEAQDPRVEVLRGLRQPAVLIGLPDDPRGLGCVDLDFAAAGRVLARHLAEHGHRALALLGPSPAVYDRGTSFATRFLRGYQQAAEEEGVRAVAHACEPSFAGVAAWLDRVESELPGLSALVVHNEAALAPLLSVLSARGRRVPEDLSVVALCPADVAVSFPVPLSAVEIPAATIGELAVEMVLDQLEGRAQPSVRLLPPEFHERASCGPAPRPATPRPRRSRATARMGS